MNELINGYADLLPFAGSGRFDTSITLPSVLAASDSYATYRARRLASGKPFTLFIIQSSSSYYPLLLYLLRDLLT